MMGSLRGRAAMIGAMMLGFSASASAVQAVEPTPTRRGSSAWVYASGPMTYGIKGAGISMAQQKRASRKARNVKRHRARG